MDKKSLIGCYLITKQRINHERSYHIKHQMTDEKIIKLFCLQKQDMTSHYGINERDIPFIKHIWFLIHHND